MLSFVRGFSSFAVLILCPLDWKTTIRALVYNPGRRKQNEVTSFALAMPITQLNHVSHYCRIFVMVRMVNVPVLIFGHRIIGFFDVIIVAAAYPFQSIPTVGFADNYFLAVAMLCSTFFVLQRFLELRL